MKTTDTAMRALGPSALIPPGEGRVFEIEGRRIAVFRTRQGALFATQAECPHRQGPLADGLVGGGHVVCPLHGFRFDLRTGDALGHACDPLTTYVVAETPEREIVLGPALARGETVRA
jgi:nitrite reductase (NADH) small subunit